jgi:hypothetical protein
MADVKSITFTADGNIIVAFYDSVLGIIIPGVSYDLSKDVNNDIEIINERQTEVTVNLVSVENFTSGKIILKSDGAGTGTIIINGTNIEIDRAETGHSLFKMDTTNPDDMIDVSIKNVNVTTASNFIIDIIQTGGILSVVGPILNAINKNISIENCNVSVPNGNIEIGQSTPFNGGIIGFSNLGIGSLIIENCNITASGNIIIATSFNGGIIGCNVLSDSGNNVVSIKNCNVNTLGNLSMSGQTNGGIIGLSIFSINGGNNTFRMENCNVNSSGIDVAATNSGAIIGNNLIVNDTSNNTVDAEINNCNVNTSGNIIISGNRSAGIMVSVNTIPAAVNDNNIKLTITKCELTSKTGNISILGNTASGILSLNTLSPSNLETDIIISDCILTSTKGSILCTKENSGSIMGYTSLNPNGTINISDCCVRFCKEFNFEGLQPIIYTLDVNNSNKEYAIRGDTNNLPDGSINVSNTKIFSLCNFELGGTIEGISPQHLQTTQGGTVRSNSRVILRRTGFSFNPNKPCQLQSGLYKDWNQNPKVPKVSQGERIRFLKLLAKNKNYNDGKL